MDSKSIETSTCADNKFISSFQTNDSNYRNDRNQRHFRVSNNTMAPSTDTSKVCSDVAKSKAKFKLPQSNSLISPFILLGTPKSNCISPVSSHRLSRQFYKTRVCPFFERGHCRREDQCTYAHSESELKTAPDLYKTKLCENWQNGSCTEKNCRFAHGRQELRFTSQVYKTRICHFWLTAECSKGRLCRHAHGSHELRTDPRDHMSTRSPVEVQESMDSSLPLRSDSFPVKSSSTSVKADRICDRKRRSYTMLFEPSLQSTNLVDPQENHASHVLLPAVDSLLKDRWADSLTYTSHEHYPTQSVTTKTNREALFEVDDLLNINWDAPDHTNSQYPYVASGSPRRTNAFPVSPDTSRRNPAETQRDTLSSSVPGGPFGGWEEVGDSEEPKDLASRFRRVASCSPHFFFPDAFSAPCSQMPFTNGKLNAPTAPSSNTKDMFNFLMDDRSPGLGSYDAAHQRDGGLQNAFLEKSQGFDTFSCCSQQCVTPCRSIDKLSLEHRDREDSMSVMRILRHSSSSPQSLLNHFKKSPDLNSRYLDDSTDDNKIIHHLVESLEMDLLDQQPDASSHFISSLPVSPKTSPTIPEVSDSLYGIKHPSLLQTSFPPNDLYNIPEPSDSDRMSHTAFQPISKFFNNFYRPPSNMDADPDSSQLSFKLSELALYPSGISESYLDYPSLAKKSSPTPDTCSSYGAHVVRSAAQNNKVGAASHCDWDAIPQLDLLNTIKRLDNQESRSNVVLSGRDKSFHEIFNPVINSCKT